LHPPSTCSRRREGRGAPHEWERKDQPRSGLYVAVMGWQSVGLSNRNPLVAIRTQHGSRLARAFAIAWLCFATPAVQDIVMDTLSWVTGSGECADNCEETGDLCTQQCGHCVCSSHTGLLPQVRPALIARSGMRYRVEATDSTMTLSGHLDPPFRPPVS
jgi:hypothetical protein